MLNPEMTKAVYAAIDKWEIEKTDAKIRETKYLISNGSLTISFLPKFKSLHGYVGEENWRAELSKEECDEIQRRIDAALTKRKQNALAEQRAANERAMQKFAAAIQAEA